MAAAPRRSDVALRESVALGHLCTDGRAGGICGRSLASTYVPRVSSRWTRATERPTRCDPEQHGRTVSAPREKSVKAVVHSHVHVFILTCVGPTDAPQRLKGSRDLLDLISKAA